LPLQGFASKPHILKEFWGKSPTFEAEATSEAKPLLGLS
jgi:hypothetical protein